MLPWSEEDKTVLRIQGLSIGSCIGKDTLKEVAVKNTGQVDQDFVVFFCWALPEFENEAFCVEFIKAGMHCSQSDIKHGWAGGREVMQEFPEMGPIVGVASVMHLQEFVDFPQQILKIVLGLLALMLVVFCGGVGGKGLSFFFVHIQGKGMPGVRFQDMKRLLRCVLEFEEIFCKGLIGVIVQDRCVRDNSTFLRIEPGRLIMGHGAEGEGGVVHIIVENKGEELFLFFADTCWFCSWRYDVSPMFFIGIIDGSIHRAIGPFFKIGLDKGVLCHQGP